MSTITPSTTGGSSVHRPQKARYEVREEGDDVVISCQYWQVRHSRAAGGNITSAVFPHGSGKNIFAAPFSTGVQRGHPCRADGFSNSRDTNPALSVAQDGDIVRLVSKTRLLTGDGKALPAECTHSYEYHPWGYIRQRLTLDFPQPTPEVWSLQIARPVVAAHLNEFAYRPSWESATEWRRHCTLGSWYKLDKGESFRDYLAVETADVPLYLMFLERGVEGFDWCCGQNLDQWHTQVTDIPHSGKFRVVCNPGKGGYSVSLAPLDIWTTSIALHGKYTFDFYMALPFVHEHVRPLLRGGGSTRPKNGAILAPHEIANLADHKAQLLRHHDDGPNPEGLFWRDVSYPPYPPPIMQKLDESIAGLHEKGVMLTPYFSLHEWHPETPEFADKAEACKRTVNARGEMIHNPTPHGEYGAQMCMVSEWEEILKRSIDRVLANHAFDGVYFDWTRPLPCFNPAHRDGIHWDVDPFIRVLEWTRERVGPDGIMYLHMSLEPFIVAENLANVVLVYESPGPSRPTADMFPPIAEFMKTCSRFVLSTEAQTGDPRRFLLYCLLNHTTTDRPSREFLEAYKTLAEIDFTRFKRFANHRVSPAKVSSPEVLTATYWNETGALVLLANLSDAEQTVNWSLDPSQIGWEGTQLTGRETLPGLSFRYVPIARSAKEM